MRLLARGVADRRSGFHTPCLASVGLDGAPSLRTVVLRRFDPVARLLSVHTDVRSAKYREIVADPRVGLHFYDPGQKIQLRINGLATLHADTVIADQAWAASREVSTACYAVEPGPGTVVAQPVMAPLPSASGRRNFAVIQVPIMRLEFLWLSSEGHRRALFMWGEPAAGRLPADGGDAASGETAQWLVP